MRITPLPSGVSMTDPAVALATGLGSGRIHPAPGTWGTLAAWLMGFAILPLGPAGFLLSAALALGLGLWAVQRFERLSQSHDLGMVVIDEWAGVWLAMAFCQPAGDQLVLAFLLFRAFDVVKPWPIGWLDRRVEGAWGVMVDDLVAGLAAGLCVYGYGQWIHLF